MIRSISLAISAATLLVSSSALAQQSAYGCASLEIAEPTPIVEGKDGFFFRKHLLRMHHQMSDQVVTELSKLSNALASRGTTLVMVPLPSKPLAEPDMLTEQIQEFGFDHDLGRQVYDRIVERLNDQGILTVNVLDKMLSVKADEANFLATDIHWTSTGARLTAQAVAETIAGTQGYDALPKTKFETSSLGKRVVFSTLRRQIQAYCTKTIPDAVTEVFETRPVESASAEQASIFADQAQGPVIALVGTSMSDTAEYNFAGFLAQETSLEVVNYSVTGGNQFGAIEAYLTSDEFRDRPPTYLVWENPIYNNLGNFGYAPLRELVVAAGDTCSRPLDVTRNQDGTISAKLAPGDISPSDSIRAEANTRAVRAASFRIVSKNGDVQPATINRGDRIESSGRFFLHMEPYWTPDVTEVRVEFDRPSAASSTLTLCTEKETQG